MKRLRSGSRGGRGLALAACLLAVGACGGGGSAGEIAAFVAGCTKISNLDQPICQCAAELAEKELTPKAFQFLVATMQQDQERMEELRSELEIQEATQAGMFMVSAPARCAGIERPS